MNRTRSMATTTTTTTTAGVAACCVDNQLLPPMTSSSSSSSRAAGRNTSLHLRRSREAAARKIIQRRLVAQCRHQSEQPLPRGMDDDCNDNDTNDCIAQESSKRNSTTTTTPTSRPPVVLVYRQEHFDYPGPYVACAFLDADSVVAAADHFGAVDVVRLPPRSINNNNNNFGQPGKDDTNTFSNACTWNRSTSSSSSTDGCKSSAASFSGRALQTGVQTYPKAPMSASFKIHPFQNGQAYAIGLASGEFRIFATETNQSIVSQWTCCSEKQAARVVKSSLCQTTNLKSTGTMDYFQHCWRHLGPQRRYKPHSSLSLLAQMRCCSSGAAVMATGALEEIFDWNRQDGHYFQGPSSPSSGVTGPLLPDCSALWDFRETTSGGGLLALHAGVYKDCFALRILDNRQSQQQQRHAIGIDWNPLYQHNLLSAVSFLSDHVIATASSPKPLGGPHINGCAALGQPCIQLFDIRMIANPQHPSSSSSSSQKSCILSNLPLAAYPREDAYGLTATKSLLASWESPVSVLAPCTKEKLLVTALEPDHARRHAAHAATTTGHFQFLKLSATSKGMLLATVRSSGGGKNGDAKKVEHLLLDPCVRHGQEATVTTVRQRCSSTWRPIFASNDQATLVCYSEGDKYHCSSAATSGNRAPAKKSHIAWHDNLQAKAYSSTTGTVPHNNLHSIGGGSGRRTLNGRIQQQQQDRKRAREQGTTIQSEHLGPIRLDTSQLRDRYWTESKLSCLALNDQATCCLGGSMDGDLYVWRAL